MVGWGGRKPGWPAGRAGKTVVIPVPVPVPVPVRVPLSNRRFCDFLDHHYTILPPAMSKMPLKCEIMGGDVEENHG